MKFLFYSILTISFINLVNSQNIEVDYDVTIIDRSESKEKPKKTGYYKAIFEQSKKDILNYPMEFIVNENGYSIDFSNSIQVDREFQKVRVSKFMALGFIGLDILIFNDGNYSYTDNNKGYITSHDINKLGNWKITNETKEINGYTCYKAYFSTNNSELKRANIIMPRFAWFTTDIPLSGGPTLFGNLPGLILELETKSAHFVATNIKNTKKKLKKINLENKKIITFIKSENLHSKKPY
jgi:GLPGLI family protein